MNAFSYGHNRLNRTNKMAKASATPVGALAKARAFALDKRKEEFENVRVKMSADDMKESLPHISSGSIVLDHLIGGIPNSFGVAPCPGFPRGRVSQIWGHEGAGKTSIALSAAAQVCREGGTVLYIDWENDIVPDYAMALGVPVTDESKFELLQPDNLEDGIKYALIYAAAGVDLIVFDSVGAAIPRRLTDRDLSEAAEQGKPAGAETGDRQGGQGHGQGGGGGGGGGGGTATDGGARFSGGSRGSRWWYNGSGGSRGRGGNKQPLDVPQGSLETSGTVSLQGLREGSA
jgi:hypothetical protein